METHYTMNATVSQRALEKVTRLFNASLTDILNELLQNARRAGASEVQITTTQRGLLLIEDNGKGIADPHVLIALGESDWSPGTVAREDPAGMGVFSLSNRGATIRSANWRMSLTSAHFCGREEVSVQIEPPIQGTRVELPLTQHELTDPYLASLIGSTVRFYPLPVLLNGQPLPKDIFIPNPLLVKQWRGLYLAVVASEGYRDRNVNFHGITLTCDLPILVCQKRYLRVMVDVAGCPDLKLVLPSRKEVVQDDFYRELRAECERMLYQYVETLPAHDLSYQDWKRARDLGITLPEAQPVLPTFVPETCCQEEPCRGEEILVPEAALLVDWEDTVTPRHEQMLWHAFQAAERTWTLMAQRDRYRGYSWYDRLPRLTWVEFELQVGGNWYHPALVPELGVQTHLAVDAIGGNVTLLTADGKRTEELWLTDVYIDEDSGNESLDTCTLFLRKATGVTEDELVSLLKACFFYWDRDSDDGYETQLTWFADAAYERAITALESNTAGLIARIERVVKRALLGLIPPKQLVEIAISTGDSWNRPISVRFKDN